MRAVLPVRMGIGVAAGAVVVAQEVFGCDMSTGGGASQRGREVRFGEVRGGWPVGQPDAECAEADGYGADRSAYRPADGTPGQPMQHEQPANEHRRSNMRPVRDRPQGGVAQLDHRYAAG